MSRKPVYREKILGYLTEGPARYYELAERLKEDFNLNYIPKKPVGDALRFFMESGYVEKRLIQGRTVYMLTPSFYQAQRRRDVSSLIEESTDLFVFDSFLNDTSPYVAFVPRDPKTKGASPPVDILDPSPPERVIAHSMLDALSHLEEKDRNDVERLIAWAYWVGIKDLIQNIDIKREKEKARQHLQSAERKGDCFQASCAKSLLEILSFYEELGSRDNLAKALELWREEAPKILRLELAVVEWYFERHHKLVLRGILRAGWEPNVTFRYYSGVWDWFIQGILFSHLEDFRNIRGSMEVSLSRLKEHEENLESLFSLPKRSTTILVYIWGHPYVEDPGMMELMKFFEEEWRRAVREGDIRVEEETVKRLEKICAAVRRGREPPKMPGQFLIDYRYFQLLPTFRRLYDFHPRGKDPEFWRELFGEAKRNRSGTGDKRRDTGGE